MKKFISLVLSIFLLSFNSLSVFAVSVDIVDDADLYFENINDTEQNDTEEKIFCDATLNDEFSDNSIVVVLKNEESLKFKEYDTFDFNYENVKGVENLTSHTFNNKKKRYQNFVKRISNKDLSLQTINNDNTQLEDENIEFSNYHQILKINLKEKSKKKVLDIIK